MIETKKAHELDVVELTEDLPEFGLRRGERGTVVEVFDNPEEAYVLEFVDESGESSKLAYGVKPEQFENIELLAKGFYRRGMEALDEGDFIEALRNVRTAADLMPSYVRAMHNSLAQAIGPHEDWGKFVFAMQLVRLLAPDYELARENLAIAYLNHGVQEAKKELYEESLRFFYAALAVGGTQQLVNLIKENIAAIYTALGGQAFRKGDITVALDRFASAHFITSSEITRLNLAKAHFHFANSCANSGDLQGAIFHYQQAQNSGLMLPEVLNNHACALAYDKQFVGATMLLESAQALAPEDNIVKSNLSKLIEISQLTESNIDHMSANFIREDVEIEFLSPPMNMVPLRIAA